MASLSFKSKYIPDILAGKKTTTMRKVGSPNNPKEGSEFTLKCGRYAPAFATARCLSVKTLKLAEMTDRQAKADGFDSAESLIKQLRETYGPQIRHVDVIKFQLISTNSRQSA